MNNCSPIETFNWQQAVLFDPTVPFVRHFLNCELFFCCWIQILIPQVEEVVVMIDVDANFFFWRSIKAICQLKVRVDIYPAIFSENQSALIVMICFCKTVRQGLLLLLSDAHWCAFHISWLFKFTDALMKAQLQECYLAIFVNKWGQIPNHPVFTVLKHHCSPFASNIDKADKFVSFIEIFDRNLIRLDSQEFFCTFPTFIGNWTIQLIKMRLDLNVKYGYLCG